MSARSCSRAIDCHGGELVVCHDRACRVVRANHDDGAHPSAGAAFSRSSCRSSVPASVKLETVVLEGNAVEFGQVLDQRIARPRRQHGIAGIAQQLEQQRICLARARRSGRFGSTGTEMPSAREIVGDGLPRRSSPEWLRLVTERPVVRQRREQPAGYAKPARVGLDKREIDNREARRAAPLEREGEPIAARRLTQTRREHQRPCACRKVEARNCLAAGPGRLRVLEHLLRQIAADR